MIIESIRTGERNALLALAVCTGLFTDEDADGLLGGVLDSYFSGELPEHHTVVACREHHGDPAIGWTYFAPDQYAENVWNVWWIGVDPKRHGTGAGNALLTYIEQVIAATGGRVVVIETSDQELLARARKFYKKAGYVERGFIPDFYALGESKVIFSRTLVEAA